MFQDKNTFVETRKRNRDYDMVLSSGQRIDLIDIVDMMTLSEDAIGNKSSFELHIDSDCAFYFPECAEGT